MKKLLVLAMVLTALTGCSDGKQEATGPVPAGWVVTATATLEPLGATSEFSANVATCWRNEGYPLPGASGEVSVVEGVATSDSTQVASVSKSVGSSERITS